MAEIPKMMKALIKNNPTQSYSYTDLEVPKPKEGEVLVKMEEKRFFLIGQKKQILN